MAPKVAQLRQRGIDVDSILNKNAVKPVNLNSKILLPFTLLLFLILFSVPTVIVEVAAAPVVNVLKNSISRMQRVLANRLCLGLHKLMIRKTCS
jgi:hypothetical protein